MFYESEYWISKAYFQFDWNEIIVEQLNLLNSKHSEIISKYQNQSIKSEIDYCNYSLICRSKNNLVFMISNYNKNQIKPRFSSEDNEYFASIKYYTIEYWQDQLDSYNVFVAKHKTNPESYRNGFVIPERFINSNTKLKDIK